MSPWLIFDEVEAFCQTRVVAVEVCGVLAVVDDEELGTACVSACVGHAQHTFVVELVVSVEFAVDGVGVLRCRCLADIHPDLNPGMTRWN